MIRAHVCTTQDKGTGIRVQGANGVMGTLVFEVNGY